MDFVSADGSFGFGGFDGEEGKEAMMSMLHPLILEMGKTEFSNPENFDLLCNTLEARHPEFPHTDHNPPPEDLIAGILAMKKFNMSVEDTVDKIANKSIVQCVFEKAMAGGSSFIDKSVGNIPTITMDVGTEFKVSGMENLPEEVKMNMLTPLFSEFSELMEAKNEKLSYLVRKTGEKLKRLMQKDGFFMVATLTVMLNWKYKVDYEECIKLTLEGKIIDECYKKFMETMGAEAMSEAMGIPPTTSVN